MLSATADPEEKTLRALRTAVATPERRQKASLRTIHTDSGSAMARAIAGSLTDMAADETFSGIYANATQRQPAVRASVCRSGIRLRVSFD